MNLKQAELRWNLGGGSMEGAMIKVVEAARMKYVRAVS